MQIEALRIFCNVARSRSFSRGATASGISQSAASQAVHQVEKYLAVQLIDRSTRPLTLTQAGQLYYGGCKSLLSRYDALVDEVRVLHRDVAGTVRVAAIYSVGLHLLPAYAERFRREHAQAELQIECLHPDRVYESVLSDEVDVGLVSYPRHDRQMSAIDWRQDEMVFVCPPQHSMATLDPVDPADLTDLPFVGFDAGLPIRRAIDRYLREHHVTVRMVLEFDNTETIKQAVSRGTGSAILPEPTIRTEVAHGTLAVRRLAGSGLLRPLAIIHRRGRPFTRTVESFIEILQQRDPGRPSDPSMCDTATKFDHVAAAGGRRNGGPLRPKHEVTS